MGEYDDAVTSLRDRGDEDLAEIFEKYTSTKLRQQAERSKELEGQVADLTSKLDDEIQKPQREKAFRDAGVDFDNLRPAERQAIKDLKGELTPEAVEKVITDLELPTVSREADEGEQPNAAGVVSAAVNAPAGSGRTAAVITPADVEQWSTEKSMAFREKHPEAWEALLKGEEVQGITA